MKICFFGIYDPGYSRNRVLAEGFRRLGHTVVHCRVDPRVHGGVRKYVALYSEYQKIKSESFGHVIVCFPGQTVVWLARILFGKRIIFDAFLSLYDSAVFDRKMYGSYDPRAWRDWLYDKTSCTLARIVLIDTQAHIDYFHDTFGIPKEKFLRVWVGSDDTIFHPAGLQEASTFTVHFHGTFIPLQGLRYIIGAAEILRDEDVNFRIIGSGQDFSKIEVLVKGRNLSRVKLIGKMPLREIPACIETAHVSLGIFGHTAKTQRVIPNKVYEAMAMGKAIITADTPALRELMPDLHAVVGVPAGDAEALADAIRSLRNDPMRRMQLGKDARTFFEARLLPERIVADLLAEISIP